MAASLLHAYMCAESQNSKTEWNYTARIANKFSFSLGKWRITYLTNFMFLCVFGGFLQKKRAQTMPASLLGIWWLRWTVVSCAKIATLIGIVKYIGYQTES